MTSSWECSVSNSLMSSWRTCGCSSWWHVQICAEEEFVFKTRLERRLFWLLVVDALPRLVELNVQECGRSVAGSTVVQTRSSLPISKLPSQRLGTWTQARCQVGKATSEFSWNASIPRSKAASTHRMHWYKVPSSATSSVAPLFSLQHKLWTVSMAFEVDFSSSLLMLTRLFWKNYVSMRLGKQCYRSQRSHSRCYVIKKLRQFF